jgi:pyrimidine deaminase RibD-like protein
MSGADDETWMRRAIGLARVSVGLTGDNPAVGCVIVRDGAVAYVTLEPCGERSSGAASCAERLARAGVTQVLISCEDPSILAAGRGVERLRAAGIQTGIGLLRDEAQGLYAAYRPRAAR